MLIKVKNKGRLIVDEFSFKCSIGKKGLKNNKVEGDKSTPKGTFFLGDVYYRSDRVQKPLTKLKVKKITKSMIWSDNPDNKYYNKLTRLKKSVKSEKLHRRDRIYDYLIVINYNTKKVIQNKGSAIFIHLTKNYKPTFGCIGLQKKDLLILLKIIKKKTKIKIG